MNPNLLLTAFRRDDLLLLVFELINLEITDDRRLVRTEPADPAVIVVHFPPQSLVEEAVTLPPSGDVPTPPIPTALSGGSRLAFLLPRTVIDLPLTLEALLRWEDWEPVVGPGALPDDGLVVIPADQPPPRAPNSDETAIEFPWRLLLSPDRTQLWRHDAEPLVLDGNTQLWRTYLSRADLDNPDLKRFTKPNSANVRALSHFPFPDGDWPPPTEDNRRDLVDLTANYGIALPAGFDPPRYRPRPIRADEFSLSALGASGVLEGKWDFPLIPAAQLGGLVPPDLQQYRHVAAQGRDHFIRTVTVGFLCGTGHRATVIVTVERLVRRLQRVGSDPNGFPLFGGTTYTIRTTEVVVQQPILDYARLAPAYAFDGREMPLRSVELLTRSATVVGIYDQPAWLMATAEDPVLFKARGTDVTGKVVEFELPLMFVPYSHLGSQLFPAALRLFRNPPPAVGEAHTIELGSQELAFAPHETKPGATTLPTERFTYDVEVAADNLNLAELPRDYIPPFAPRVLGATAVVPAVAELLGAPTPLAMVFDNLYLTAGFGVANRAQSFLRFPEIPLDFGAQRGGGLARPSNAAEALSRTLGTVSAPDTLAAGNIDLSAFTDAKFLGTIRLRDLLPTGPIPFSGPAAATDPPTQAQLDDADFHLDAPRLTTRRLPDGVSIETRFVWKPQLKTRTLGILTVALDEADLLIDATLTRSPSGAGSAVTLGRLRNAALSFKDAISVHFDRLLFRAEEGKKLDVGASNAVLRFGGPLNFINALQKILPTDGFDDPPFLTVDGQGVVAGYTLGVPSVGVGIFSLQNIALSAALSVPFADRPAGVRFSISERHAPFLVTVSLFGGGGFFAMAVSADGLEQIEASIEFGGNISLNLVVASGGVHVMAGIYFGLTATSVTLTGYLRCGGSLEVLGLISVSVEFYLAFTYRKKNPGGSEVWGQASLTVSIEIAFFSTSVSLSVERRFAGSDGDPTFAQAVTPRDWATYLQAFAA